MTIYCYALQYKFISKTHAIFMFLAFLWHTQSSELISFVLLWAHTSQMVSYHKEFILTHNHSHNAFNLHNVQKNLIGEIFVGSLRGKSCQASDHHSERRPIPTSDSHFGVYVCRWGKRSPRSITSISQNSWTTQSERSSRSPSNHQTGMNIRSWTKKKKMNLIQKKKYYYEPCEIRKSEHQPKN